MFRVNEICKEHNIHAPIPKVSLYIAIVCMLVSVCTLGFVVFQKNNAGKAEGAVQLDTFTERYNESDYATSFDLPKFDSYTIEDHGKEIEYYYDNGITVSVSKINHSVFDSTIYFDEANPKHANEIIANIIYAFDKNIDESEAMNIVHSGLDETYETDTHEYRTWINDSSNELNFTGKVTYEVKDAVKGWKLNVLFIICLIFNILAWAIPWRNWSVNAAVARRLSTDLYSYSAAKRRANAFRQIGRIISTSPQKVLGLTEATREEDIVQIKAWKASILYGFVALATFALLIVLAVVTF